MGPSTVNSTMTGIIEAKFRSNLIPFYSALRNVYTSAQIVSELSSNISSNLQSGLFQIKEFHDSLLSFESHIESSLVRAYETFERINDLFYAVWAIDIFSSLLAIIATILVYRFKWIRFRHVLNFSWFLISIFMVLGFALSAVFMSLRVFMVESCDIYDGFISSPTSFNGYPEIIPSDITNVLQRCLFDDGDLTKAFGIEGHNQINNISTAFNKLNKWNTNPNFTLNDSDSLIEFWEERINNLMFGEVNDSLENNDNNSFESIKSFNKWSDYSTLDSLQKKTCNYTQDNWVFNSSSCTYSTKWISNTSIYQLGDPLCIQLQDFTFSNITNRYGSMGNCEKNVSQNIVKYFNALQAYDISRKNLFLKIGNDLSNLRANNGKYNDDLLDFNQKVYRFIREIDSLRFMALEMVPGLNCSFLRNKFRNSHDYMCYSWFMPLYPQMVLICISSLLMFFMSLLTWILGVRFRMLRNFTRIEVERVTH